MKLHLLRAAILVVFVVMFSHSVVATSNRYYRPDEYAVVNAGLSPDGKYSVASHGEGEYGYDNFHIYLMDAKSGKKIGPLEEIKDNLDTGPEAIYAQWSPDSREVSITYRVDRHAVKMVRYRIENRRAYLISGPSSVARMPNN